MAQERLTQQALADRLECSQRIISDWLSGKSPRPLMLRRLEEFFDIPIFALENGKELPPERSGFTKLNLHSRITREQVEEDRAIYSEIIDLNKLRPMLAYSWLRDVLAIVDYAGKILAGGIDEMDRTVLTALIQRVEADKAEHLKCLQTAIMITNEKIQLERETAQSGKIEESAMKIKIPPAYRLAKRAKYRIAAGHPQP